MAEKEEIKKEIEGLLYADSRVNPDTITVEMADGRVVLNGTVNSLAALNAVEDTVRSFHQITFVENRLKIVYPGDADILTDESVTKAVKISLKLNCNINDEFVGVDVEEGVVELSGAVDSYWQKIECGNIVSNVTGVIQVINKLSVVPVHKVEDFEIAEQIEAAMKRTGIVDTDYVTVKVENGIVTLTGKVPHWNAYNSAEFAAKHTKGVIDVRNELILA
ncbi:MAG: BON domain-containing protein [Fibrobacter sp.]|nr:BON domain-containing protein [Fibrobacter sp.]